MVSEALTPMPHIMFIKTSSLGDVVHNMPAVADVRRHIPDAHITWVLEEQYAPLASLHPGVNEVVTVATRRWRRELRSSATWREIAATRSRVGSRTSDIVIDTQGLVRSAVLTWFARGVRHGYDANSIREPLAAWLYQIAHRVPKELHAIDRNRRLTAAALGFAMDPVPDFGLPNLRAGAGSAHPYAVLLHGSAEVTKEWSEEHWRAVARALSAEGLGVTFASGTEEERQRSKRLAFGLAAVEYMHGESLDDVAKKIAGARLVVGLDTGLLHVAAAFGVPLVAIFAGSDPGLTGPRGPGPMVVLGNEEQGPEARDVLDAALGLLRGA
ncbi:MAG: heptosyltransferase [Variibacter sp.]|jgi:heptosyltransferase-1|nr:heptosyltransferase [Variibacter sp.]